MAEVAATPMPNNLKTLNDTQYLTKSSENPGLDWITPSDNRLDYPVSQSRILLPQRKKTVCYTPPEGVKTLSVPPLPKRVKTSCQHSPPEGDRTLCYKTLPEREKTLCLYNQYHVSIQEKSDSPQVGGRLQLFLQEWIRQGAHSSIIQLIQNGYCLPFRERPKLSRTPCINSGYSGSIKQSALLTSIQDLLQKGAIEIVQNSDSLGFYSRLFLVPKPGNRWRPVIDLSSLNKFLAIPKFKMETPESIRASLRKGEWVTSIDLTDAYLHVPINKQSRKYLRFFANGIIYQFKSLPFGLATAPLVFTNLVKEVKLMALQQDIRLHQYLDDWLIRAPSHTECQHQTHKLLELVKALGFLVNIKKSELIPSQRFDFLGYHFLLDSALVRPTQDRWSKLQMAFQRLSQKPVTTARKLMSAIGLLAATEKTVKLGRIHMRPFQWHLKKHWKFPMPLDSTLPWTPTMIRHGQWWLDPQNVLTGHFLHPREHEKLIFTDASNAGWGAHLEQKSIGGLWSHQEKHLHINVLEMKAVFLALQHFKTDCYTNQVLIASDNTSVVAYINKQGGTKSAELCALIWRILAWCNKNQVTLRARHVPGSLNVIADGLSRRDQIQNTEWSLSPKIFHQITQIWELPQIDLFATSLNTKLPRYVSPIPDKKAWAVDALNIPWEDLIAYAFPPTALLPKVIQKLQSQSCRMILIAPGWPSKPWFWDLVQLSLDIPRQLPPIKTLLKQPLNNQYHSNPSSLNLHVWYLGVQHSNNMASLQKWQRELLHLRDPRLERSTLQSGQFSRTGVQNNRWTSGLPL